MTAIEKPRKIILMRRACYALVLFVLSVIQNTDGFFPAPFAVRAIPLIPAVVCIAMNERDVPGMFFGLFAGTLWDISASGSNFNALFLLTVGFLCGTLINTIMRNNIVTALLLSAAALLIYNTGYWVFQYVFRAFEAPAHMLLRYYLPGAAYTLALMPFMFFGIRAIERAFRTE